MCFVIIRTVFITLDVEIEEINLSPQGHRWELPGNYRDFIMVMVFYLFFRRTKRILVTPITDFKIYILLQSLMLFI